LENERNPYARRWINFIFLWKLSVMPLLRVKRHMRTISSVHSDKDLARVQASSRPLSLRVWISWRRWRAWWRQGALALGFEAQECAEFFLQLVDAHQGRLRSRTCFANECSDCRRSSAASRLPSGNWSSNAVLSGV